jgi:hypothetical protein
LKEVWRVAFRPGDREMERLLGRVSEALVQTGIIHEGCPVGCEDGCRLGWVEGDAYGCPEGCLDG